MADETDTKIIKTLFTHLEALTTDPPLEIAWPEVNHPRHGNSKPDEFLEVQFLPNQPRQITLGSDPQELRGILQVSVKWKSGNGIIDALNVAGQIIKHFKDQVLFSADGSVRVVIDGVPWASPNIPDGARMKWPVSIPYHAFEEEA